MMRKENKSYQIECESQGFTHTKLFLNHFIFSYTYLILRSLNCNICIYEFIEITGCTFGHIIFYF